MYSINQILYTQPIKNNHGNGKQRNPIPPTGIPKIWEQTDKEYGHGQRLLIFFGGDQSARSAEKFFFIVPPKICFLGRPNPVKSVFWGVQVPNLHKH